VFARLGVSTPATTSKTLSGFLAEQLGQVPAAGATVDVGEFTFLVTKANNRRAERVQIARRERAAATDDARPGESDAKPAP
jgi:CBS domain containing-hemolysin-like protein